MLQKREDNTMDEEKEPFLEENIETVQKRSSTKTRWRSRTILITSTVLNMLLLLGNLFLYLHRNELPSRNETCYSHFPNS